MSHEPDLYVYTFSTPADFENGAVKEEALGRVIAGNIAPQLPGTDPAELREFLRRCVPNVLAALLPYTVSVGYWFPAINARVTVVRASPE